MSHSTMRSTQPRNVHGTARVSLIAIGVAVASLLALDVQAQESLRPRIAVDYADLDLSVPADADALYTRLQKAAKSVCGQFGIKDLRGMLKQRECYRDSLGEAVMTVNHNSITRLYQADKSIKLAEQRSDATPRS